MNLKHLRWLLLFFFFPAYLSAEKPQEIIKAHSDGPWLGVQISDVSEKLLRNMGIDYGVRVDKVFKNSPAEEIGLEKDDILIAFGDNTLQDSEHLADLVHQTPVGDKVNLKYLREGKKLEAMITIGERKGKILGQMLKKFSPVENSRYRYQKARLGVTTDNLNNQLREYFQAPDDLGVLIKEVIKESPAEKYGLKAGDIIIRIADRKIKNTRDVVRTIDYFDPEDEIEVEIIREKTSKTVVVQLDHQEVHPLLEMYGAALPEIDIEIPDFEIPDIEIEFDEDQLREFEELMQKEFKLKSSELKEELKALDQKLDELKFNIKNHRKNSI